MSDELFASLVTLGLLAALSLWVPLLDRIQRFLNNQVTHKHEE
jgi:hypothetical protein